MSAHCENDHFVDPNADLIEHLTGAKRYPEITGQMRTTKGSGYIEAFLGCGSVELDGEFGIADLEAIIEYMRNADCCDHGIPDCSEATPCPECLKMCTSVKSEEA